VGITLRAYRAGDLNAMHALDVICFEPPFRFTHSAMRRFAEAKNARVVIAEERGALVGFVILHIEDAEGSRYGYVVTLDVSPGHRRMGLAGQLMHEVERQALAEGSVAVVLHVFTGNDHAIGFYEKHDFVRSYREPDFYGRDSDAWVFHKPLHSASE
jgi:ribosomal protein S18 acetylase RimI-like enzyme